MTAPAVPAPAWEAIKGALDLHVHAGPDVMPRLIDDVDLAREFQRHGLRGFVLKSHYLPTPERAKAVARAVPGVEVIGSLTLNHAVGGLNPVALEVAARSGARVVWMPSVDAANERASAAGLSRAGSSAGAPPPAAWADFQGRLMRRPGYPAPISLLDEAGHLSEATQACLEVIAEYDLVLCTGHVGRAEIFALLAGAQGAGAERFVVTHPEFTSIRLSAGDQVELARGGAFIEHCYTTAYTGKVDWDTMLANIRAVGPERCVISTDLGQVSNPAVTTGMADFAQRLLEIGISSRDVNRMVAGNPAQLVLDGRDARP